MTIKATSLLSIIAIWATMIPAVIAQPGAWWALLFAFMATGAIGIGAFRRLGLSRLIAITGIWLATAIAIADNSGNAWMAVFAFLSTGATVYSIMKRDAYMNGVGIAVAWLVAGMVAGSGGPAWLGVFAFLTTMAVANAFRRHTRGIIATVAWGVAGVIMLGAEGYYWLSVIAFLATVTTFWVGGGFNMPRSFEWDIFERDDPADRAKPVN